MDLREIIKWFIPCFHILLKLDARMILIWLIMFCHLCSGISASEIESNLNNTKNVSYDSFKFNQSEVYNKSLVPEELSNEETSVGRTFGRPMKKMMQALIPLAMAIGSAGTWAVVAALIGAKTLVVTLFILKLLLMAGAAKFGGLLGAKLHHQPPPHYAPPPTSWSRDSPVSSPASISSKVSAKPTTLTYTSRALRL
ncbi:uncharacterized protein LOC125238743 isoform X2 [Leguminivora glycinivorella]|uniref:uncharacterized protein LOC125238743 isoform X2 n=1 Tax=Leguminivora glycinivorella TaxID=1035111 RepID=UPI00200FBBD6|nr:uncharacterized protein LOC125238743 isoform X2 [Leguminivora glycinivorella]